MLLWNVCELKFNLQQHIYCNKVLSFCVFFFAPWQTPPPIPDRSLRQLSSAARLKSAAWWTSTLQTPPWTKVRPAVSLITGFWFNIMTIKNRRHLHCSWSHADSYVLSTRTFTLSTSTLSWIVQAQYFPVLLLYSLSVFLGCTCQCITMHLY